MITLPLETSGGILNDLPSIKSSAFPALDYSLPHPKVLAPSRKDLLEILSGLNSDFQDIIILTISSRLNQTYGEIEKSIPYFSGSARIYLIDTQTVSLGQGFLVEMAARAACKGKSAIEIERMIRKTIPHVFNLFCSPSLSYLYHTGIIDQPQAIVGDYYNLIPLFVLEDDQITPLIKVRNYHAAVESFLEFLGEFEGLNHISILHGGTLSGQDIRTIKQFCEENFPQTPFSEHQINPYLSALFGPGFLGLFISEQIKDIQGNR